MDLKGKKVIALGERDGVQGGAHRRLRRGRRRRGGAGEDVLLRLNRGGRP